jgi:hypothetical protein
MQLRTTPTTKKGKHRLRKVITIRKTKENNTNGDYQ